MTVNLYVNCLLEVLLYTNTKAMLHYVCYIVAFLCAMLYLMLTIVPHMTGPEGNPPRSNVKGARKKKA
jgi:hypothetical protein